MNKIKLALATSALILSNIALADLNTGLVAHWSFDDCTSKDVSGHGHDGIINGSPQCIDSIIGKGFSFNGKTDFIDVLDHAELNPTAMTMVAWIKPRTLTGVDKIVLNKENQYEFQIMGQNSVHSATKQHTAFAFNPNWWWFDADKVKPSVSNYTQVIITFDKNYHGKSYINGKLGSDISYSSAIQTTSSCLRIGARGCDSFSNANSFFDGVIDDVRVYNRALSASEIKSLYQQVYPPLIKGTAPWGASHLVTCENITQGTILVLPQTTASAWDCEKAGLTINSGDDVVVSIKGKKY